MRQIAIALALLSTAALALAQEKEPKAPVTTQQVTDTGLEARLPKDFLGLADLRATTNSDIANLEKEAKDIEEERLPRAEELKDRIADLKGIIAELEKVPKRSNSQQAKLDEARNELRFRERREDPQRLSQRLGEIQQQLKTKRALASQLQTRIAALLSPEQEFKRTMSIVFASLIAVVIVGFFVIAFRDERIRAAIFSGEAGIQFLTLFSLVIAIILFGITQILEGKELAALLGGLSGYILGRTIPRA